MDADHLIQAILDIRIKLEKGLFVNEASISQGVVRRLLDALGWPQWDTRVVAPEYSIGGLRVDFALCHPPDKPIAFLEVKQPGKAVGTEVQLLQYAFHKGVPLAILTDGRTWQFFLPTEIGEYSERRLHTLDLVEREPFECAERLTRYLAYDGVRNGDALRQAHADFTAQNREREANLALPEAWARLVDEEDSLLLDLLAEAAEQISGLRPTLEQTGAYLRRLSHATSVPRPVSQISARAVTETPSPVLTTPGPIRIRLREETWTEPTAKSAYIAIFKRLADADSSFLEHFAALPRHGRKRRYLARERQELFPGRPDLQHQFSEEIRPGWWLGVNEGRGSIVRIVRMAAGVANLDYGVQIEII